VNLYDLEALSDKNSIYFDENSTSSGLYPGKVCVSKSKTRGRPSSGIRYKLGWSGHSTAVSVMNQKKNKRMPERQSRESQALQAFKVDAALNEAMYKMRESRGITQLEATRGNWNMWNIHGADYAFPGDFSPEIAINPFGNIPSAGVYQVNDQNNANCLGTLRNINSFFGYLSPGSPVYMGKKPEVEDPKIFPENGGHTSNKDSYPNRLRENETSAEILHILENACLSSNTTETMMTKNGESSIDLNVEKEPSGSLSDFEPLEASNQFGLGSCRMSQILKGAFSDDSDSMSNQERREGETKMDRTENENFEDIVNEINLKFSSSSSEFDFNTIIAESDTSNK